MFPNTTTIKFKDMLFVQNFIRAKRRSDKDVLKNAFRPPCTLHIQRTPKNENKTSNSRIITIV